MSEIDDWRAVALQAVFIVAGLYASVFGVIFSVGLLRAVPNGLPPRSFIVDALGQAVLVTSVLLVVIGLLGMALARFVLWRYSHWADLPEGVEP